MKDLPKTNAGLAYFYILVFIPLLSIGFVPTLRGIMAGSSDIDALVVIGYILIILMFFYVVISEIRKPVISKELPYLALPIIFGIFISIPFIFYLADPPTYNYSISWIKKFLLVLICLLLPFLAFFHKISPKAKVVSILIAVLYAIYHFFPVLLANPEYNVPFYNFIRRNLRNPAAILIWLEAIYMIMAYILNGLEHKENGPMFFTGIAGLYMVNFAINHPVAINRGSLEKYRVLINGVDSGTTYMSSLEFNWLIAIGMPLIALIFIGYLAAKKEDRV